MYPAVTEYRLRSISLIVVVVILNNTTYAGFFFELHELSPAAFLRLGLLAAFELGRENKQNKRLQIRFKYVEHVLQGSLVAV